MIRNTDGTVYNPVGSIQQFDPENPEFNLLNSYDQEIIHMTGTPVYYYEVLIQPQTVDPLYLEDRGKLFSPVPIELWALYEPQASQNLQTAFGIDAPDEMIFEMNYREVLQLIGHPPKVGSRIFTPHKSENWIIIQKADSEFKMWGQMRLQLICQKWQENATDASSVVKQPQPDFKIN